jgi:abortive infection bacteriophage resistance protein
MNNKTFLTYEEQVNKLQEEKGLLISDRKYAYIMLQELSYYSLIGGYKTLFKHAPSNKYKTGVTFEEIVNFYYFDDALRSLFLKYILHVERHMKSIISYYFCEKHGESDSEYLNISNYNVTKKNASDVNRLIHSLSKAISSPSNYSYINHYAHNYNNIPLWVAMNTFTFGQVSKIYQYIPNDIQAKISQNFEHISERELHQFITVIARCRNVCAHGERLYSFHVRETIPDTTLHDKLNIPRKNNQYTKGKQDLFSIVIALRYLISKEDFKLFKQELMHLIRNVLKNCSHISQQVLYSEMGFPSNWEKITRYKK